MPRCWRNLKGGQICLKNMLKSISLVTQKHDNTAYLIQWAVNLDKIVFSLAGKVYSQHISKETYITK